MKFPQDYEKDNDTIKALFYSFQFIRYKTLLPSFSISIFLISFVFFFFHLHKILKSQAEHTLEENLFHEQEQNSGRLWFSIKQPATTLVWTITTCSLLSGAHFLTCLPRTIRKIVAHVRSFR